MQKTVWHIWYLNRDGEPLLSLDHTFPWRKKKNALEECRALDRIHGRGYYRVAKYVLPPP
jgi:hypothetical protein